MKRGRLAGTLRSGAVIGQSRAKGRAGRPTIPSELCCGLVGRVERESDKSIGCGVFGFRILLARDRCACWKDLGHWMGSLDDRKCRADGVVMVRV